MSGLADGCTVVKVLGRVGEPRVVVVVTDTIVARVRVALCGA